MVNSGSSANLIASQELSESVRVATPALTFPTTLAYLLDRNLELVDVEEGTYQIDFDKIESEPDALFIPNLLGNIPDWDSGPNVTLIEDSCDTITDVGGQRSIISTTSFYASHIVTACGGGGMLMTDDNAIADRARSKRAWGRPMVEESDLDGRFIEVDGIVYDARFTYDNLGYNFQPLEIQAAFGLVQLDRFPSFKSKRDANFDRLYRFFSRWEDLFILPRTRKGANWLAFPITIREGIDRSKFARYLEEMGIQTRPIFAGNITRHPYYMKVIGKKPFPVADKIMQDGLLLGAHHGLDDEHLSYMEETIERYIASLI